MRFDNEAGFTYDATTDGDIVSCNISRDSGSGQTLVEMRVLYDSPFDTYVDLNRDYYPFWKAQVKVTRSSSASDAVSVNMFYDGYVSTVDTTISTLSDWTTLRANHKASTDASGVGPYFMMGAYLDATDDWVLIQFDYLKAYSIANFSLSQSGSCTTSDVLYVDSGILIGDKTTGTYISLNYDPVLAVDTDTYTIASVSIPDDFVWLGGGTYGFAITTTISAVDDTQFDPSMWDLESGTLTDFTIFINGIGNISALTFMYQLPEWNVVGTAELIFSVLYDPWGINVLLIFFGLCLIPLSVVYLVKGGRDEASMDKVFYALVAFIFGWALFLGGIFI